jgi:hypothetical protein
MPASQVFVVALSFLLPPLPLSLLFNSICDLATSTAANVYRVRTVRASACWQNYVYWYPFDAADATFAYRFGLKFDPPL